MPFRAASAVLILTALISTCPVHAQSPATGPVIEGYGPVFEVPANSYNLVPGHKYKVSWDVGSGPEDPSELNRSINSVARFINMHARNGIDIEDLDIAVVLHGAGARAALNASAHKANFDVANGTAGLIAELGKQGVDIYLCGQTAGYYGYGIDDLLPEVTMAVSAMTVHVRLQTEGFTLIPF